MMSIMSIGSDTLNIYEVGDEMGLRGWHLDRQHYPASLHVTVNFAHVGKTAVFLQDLSDSIRIASRASLRKTSNNVAAKVINWLVKILPDKWVSRLMKRVSSLVGGGGGLPERSAAMYGMMGSLSNRGDLKEVVLDLVEQFTQPQDSW